MANKFFYLGNNEKEDYLQNSWSGIYGNLTTIKYIVLHDYAGGINLTAKQGAKSTVDRMRTNGDSANYHHVVDSKDAYAVIREDRCAYHTASQEGNKYAIGIEIAPSLTSGNFANNEDKKKYYKAWLNACKLVADYCVKYNLSTSKIKQHNQFSATACPYTMKMYFGSYEKALSETKKEVDKNIKIIKNGGKAPTTYYTYGKVIDTVSTRYGDKTLIEFTGDTGIYRDENLHKKDSAKDFVKGQKQLATYVGWRGKYEVYTFKSNNGESYYFRIKTKK